MDSISKSSNKDNVTSIDYEEAMNMLLKSLEKSEVFQLRKYITKMVAIVGAVLVALDIIIVGYLTSVTNDTAALKEDANIIQKLLVSEQKEETEETEETEIEILPPIIEPIPADEIVDTQTIKENAEKQDKIEEYYVVLNELLSRQECTEDWYREYKSIITEYADVVDPPEMITDIFSEKELDLIYRCVETETCGGTFWGKVNVANVIFNRFDGSAWGDTITEIITQPGQFAYNNSNVVESTKLAVEYAYLFADTTQGAEYFNSGDPVATNSSKTYLFTDDIGHSFYKKTETNYNSDEKENIDDEDGVG